MAQIVLYLVFGFCTVLVNLAFYFLFRTLFNVTLSSVFAWIIAVIFAFITNKLFVFKSKTKGTKQNALEGIKFLSARIFSEVLELFLLNIMLTPETPGKKEALIKAVINFLVIVINYLLSRLFVFKAFPKV